jgi:hypothetical protein
VQQGVFGGTVEEAELERWVDSSVMKLGRGYRQLLLKL